MREHLPDIGGGLIADVAAALIKDLPFGNTLGAVAGGLFKQLDEKRMGAALDLLLDEIADGKRPAKDVKEAGELLAILHRYLEAARQGTARLNLRLMAKVLRGQFEREEISAEAFLRHAAILSTLTGEEVVFLATLCRHYRQAAGRDSVRVYRDVVEVLAGGSSERRDELQALATGVQRTGLVNPIIKPVLGGAGYHVEPSPQLWKLVEFASLEDALRAEGARDA